MKSKNKIENDAAEILFEYRKTNTSRIIDRCVGDFEEARFKSLLI